MTIRSDDAKIKSDSLKFKESVHSFSRVPRYDDAEIKNDATTWEELPNGSLRVPVTITRTGVFQYTDSLGNTINELRHPDQVFKKDSVNTARSIIVTDNHPPVMVTPKNANLYQKGLLDPVINQRGQYLDTYMTITDEDLIKLVKNGKREVSLGYYADTIAQSGVWNGQKYDSIQKNIIYNHLSVVDKGRAGANVKIRMDSDSEEIEVLKFQNILEEKGEIHNMAKIRIDSVEYEIPDSVAHVVDGKIKDLSTKLDSLVSEKTGLDQAKATLSSEKEALKGKYDALEVEYNTLKTKLDGYSKKEVIEQAKDFLPKETKFDNMDVRQIKEAAIKAKNANFDTAGKSDEYVNAVFDSLLAFKPTQKRELKQDSLYGFVAAGINRQESSDEVISVENEARKIREAKGVK